MAFCSCILRTRSPVSEGDGMKSEREVTPQWSEKHLFVRCVLGGMIAGVLYGVAAHGQTFSSHAAEISRADVASLPSPAAWIQNIQQPAEPAPVDLALLQGPDGDDQLKNLSLEQLGQVKVTSYRKAPTELWNTPAAVYIITRDDIQRSGATSIADALRLAPGVEVGRLSSTTWAVSIRGLQNNFSKSVLVLIDGRNVYTPLFAGTYWDVQDMPLDDIDHIEVIRGPGGTIWGPNSANGVINIITRNATETHGWRASVLGGTVDHTMDDLQYGGGSPAFSYRAYGRGFERGHERHADGNHEDAWHQERLGFRTDYTSPRDQYMLEGSIYRGDSPRILGTTPYDDRVSGGDLNFRWQRFHDDGSGLLLQAYFDRTLRTNDPLSETRDTIDIDFVQHLRKHWHQQISYGGGLRWSPYHLIAANPNDTLVPDEATDHVHTAFIQDEIHFTPATQLTVGAKLQHNNFSGFDVQPSARFLWNPSEHQAVWLGVTRSVTTPSDLEEDFLLQASAPGLVIQVLGNHGFKSENVMGYEAGYRRLFGERAYVDVAAFWNEYHQLQSFSPAMIARSGGTTSITIQYQNAISGSTSGFEITPQVSLAQWWRMNLSYSYVNSDFSAAGATSDISSTGSVNTYERSSPKHLISLQSKIDLPARFQFDQTYRYVSALPAQKVAAYQTMDARLARSFGPHVSLELVGQNLFQRWHNEWGTGDLTQPAVGIYRAAYARLVFSSASPTP